MRNRRLAKQKRLAREADEIIRRLQMPVDKKRLMPQWPMSDFIGSLDIQNISAIRISDEIDRDVLEQLRKYK